MPKFISNKFTTDLMSLLTQASICITPNGYKEGKLYSVIPSDGSGDLSVTRATTATRVNSSGLVELVPYNLNTYSENFTTSWGNDGTSTTTNNFTTAPNGTMTAAKTVANFANGYAYKSLPVPSGTYTLSYYVKASAPTTINIAFNDVGGNGYIGSYGIAVTTEWQRISLTANLVGSNLYIDYSQLQLGVDYYIWGAQLNEGTIKPYQKTETRLNIPRLDYSNGTCPSLLVEPQRTNLALWSSSFSNVAWTSSSGTTLTSNYGIAPNGLMQSTRIQWSSNQQFLYQIIASAGQEASTIYIKGIAGETIKFGRDNTVANGTLFTLDGTWQRLELSTNNGGVVFFLSTFNAGNATDFEIWGAQLEAGSYATSYIPTTSASVTRNADVISKTGISSLIGQTEGVVFFEIDAPNPNANGGVTMIQVGTGSSRIYIAKESSTQNIFQLATQSASGYNFINTANITTSTIKFAIAYKNGDNAFYVNGSLISIASATANPTSFSQLNFGDTTWGNTDTKIKAAALWKTRLTNDQLEALTGIGFNTYAEMASYYNYILQ